MSRYIDAEKLKESVEGLQDCYNGFSDTYDKACIIGLIDEEPTADVVPVVRGKWKLGVCQKCFFDWSEVTPLASVPNFCPNCGAKMDEVTE